MHLYLQICIDAAEFSVCIADPPAVPPQSPSADFSSFPAAVVERSCAHWQDSTWSTFRLFCLRAFSSTRGPFSDCAQGTWSAKGSRSPSNLNQ